MVEEKPIGFAEIAAMTRTVNSKDRAMKLKDCIDFELKNLLQKVNEYNKGGKLTITLDIGIAEKNELNIQAEVKINAPKGKKPNNSFYRDSKGELYLDDPNQMHLIDPQVVRNLREEKGEVINA
ncbi:TPA: hypothetical protein CPT89_01170 [Candidatus Gastranaerophilales bacterium HUM_11]|nr:MAG TPA: hypothetical protein CPT89_01170 [Candidatus Gastranaerophilales bacterium HUM_11]DAX39352.1 MAG TPA: hypothetical protein [Caudoviricetes sp.]